MSNTKPKPKPLTQPSKPKRHYFVHTCTTGNRVLLVIEQKSRWSFGHFRLHWPGSVPYAEEWPEYQRWWQDVEHFISAQAGRRARIEPYPFAGSCPFTNAHAGSPKK